MKRFILAIICAGLVAGSLPAYLAQEQPGKLARLIQYGHRSAALEMIRAGADVNEAQLDGTRPVHWAVYRVDHELMAQLIAKKAKVDVSNEFGYTPLAEAVKQGDTRMVKMLMDAGSGTEGANADGQTALMIAIKNGNLAIFQMLIDAGAKVNVVEKVQEQTPLMWAASATGNAAEMVKVLIAKGATVNARARFNDWPAQITSEPRAQYHPYGGLTALIHSARGGCLACVEALISAGADVNLPAPEGITPLMVAIDNNNNDIAKYLLEHGGNPHLWDVYGRTALYIAVDKAAAGGGGGGAAPGGGGRGGGAGAGGRGGAPGGAGAAVPAIPGGGQAAGAQPPAGGRGGGAPGGAPGQAPGGRGGGGGAGAGAQGRGGAGGGGGAQGGRGGGGGFGGGGRGGGGGAPASTVTNTEIINLLLAAGVDVNPQLNQRRLQGQGGRFGDPLLSSGTTPLMRAMVANNTELVTLLLQKGGNPNIYGMGLNPFLYAAGVTTVSFNEVGGGGGGGARGGGGAAAGGAAPAPAAGAAVPAAGGAPAGPQAAGGAARGGGAGAPAGAGAGGAGAGGPALNTQLLDLMLQHGADINSQVNGATSYNGRVARVLTQNPETTKTNEGMTALHVAVRSGNTAMVRYLLDHGARTDIRDASERTPLDVLNGVVGRQPAVFADASGLAPKPDPSAPPPVAAPPAGGARGAAAPYRPGGTPAAAQEVRTMLEAAQKK